VGKVGTGGQWGQWEWVGIVGSGTGGMDGSQAGGQVGDAGSEDRFSAQGQVWGRLRRGCVGISFFVTVTIMVLVLGLV
jgi:hypothetical protein